MDYFAGLDVSLDTISVCIVNADGDILLEKKIEAEPAAIVAVLKHFGHPFKRIERLDRLCRQLARRDTVCRRLMTVPGVGEAAT